MHDEFTIQTSPARYRRAIEYPQPLTKEIHLLPALRVIVYCRVSTKDQDDYGTSLERQEKLCREYAARMGWEVVDVYTEDYSGLTLDRPTFNIVRDLYQHQGCDVLLVSKVDRLSRDMADPALVYKDLELSRVALHTVEDGGIDDRQKFLFFMMKANIAAGYVADFKKNAKGGRQDRATVKGRIIGGHWLFGYTYVHGDKRAAVGGVRVVNQKQARIVRYVFHLYVCERLSLAEIAGRLARIGAKTARGHSHWSRASLYKMLVNVSYTGRTWALLTDDQLEPTLLPENTTPRLITDDLYAMAKVLLHENKGSGGPPTRDYLLSGLIVCTDCGRRYSAGTKAKVGKNGKNYAYVSYTCNRSIVPVAYLPGGRNECGSRPLAARFVEEQVWGPIRDYILEPKKIEAEMEKRRAGDSVLLTERDLEIVNESLVDLEAEEVKLIKFARTAPENETSQRLIATEQAEIAQRRAQLEGQRGKLVRTLEQSALSQRQRANLLALCAELAGRIDHLTTAEKNHVMRLLHVEARDEGETVRVTGWFPTYTVALGETGAVTTRSHTSGHSPRTDAVPFAFTFALAVR